VEDVTRFDPGYDNPWEDERAAARDAAQDADWDDPRPTPGELAEDEHLTRLAERCDADERDAMPGPMLTITADQVTYVAERDLVPNPDRDVHWFHVRIRPGRSGWAYASRTRACPTPAEVAAELTDLQARLGSNVVEGRMLGGGMELVSSL
jgi:hypothetical protein